MKNYKNKDGLKLDEEIVGPLSDKLTDAFEYLMPQRKERKRTGRTPSSTEEEDDSYVKELRNRKRARYEALKEKYRD